MIKQLPAVVLLIAGAEMICSAYLPAACAALAGLPKRNNPPSRYISANLLPVGAASEPTASTPYLPTLANG
jgi:hypothetical protein